jgi:hypothetical protein
MIQNGTKLQSHYSSINGTPETSMSKSQPIADVKRREEREIREHIDKFVQPTSAASSKGRLHISRDGDPLCVDLKEHNGRGPLSKDATEYVEKDPAVFPVGYRDLCKYCVMLWREVRDAGD